MSTDQVLAGVGLIVVLAVGSQVLASRLRIPAVIILLPAGFITGTLTTYVNSQRLLGAAFEPLVSLVVAVILYDSGLALEWGKIRGRARRVVPRLVYWGVPVTMAFAAVLVGPLLGMSAGAAVMIGAILVVSGPTVVGPLLAFVRPSHSMEHHRAQDAADRVDQRALPRHDPLETLVATKATRGRVTTTRTATRASVGSRMWWSDAGVTVAEMDTNKTPMISCTRLGRKRAPSMLRSHCTWLRLAAAVRWATTCSTSQSPHRVACRH